YTMGATGHVFCLDAKSGKVLWQKDTAREFKAKVPMWGHACSPLVEGKKLIIQAGGPGACLVALDRESGKEIWRALDDPAGYCSPVSVETGKWRQLVFFTPKAVVGLDPDKGKELWRVPFPGITYGVAISDVVYGDGVLLAGNYWSGSKGIRLDDKRLNPKVAWSSDSLCLLMSTPLVGGKYAYALDKKRGLVCLEMATGKV